MNEWKLENPLNAMCSAGKYRTMRLHAPVLEELDQHRGRTGAGAGRRRALAATGDGPYLESKADTSIRYREVARILAAGSAARRLVPTGATARTRGGGPLSGRNRG